MPNIYHKCGNNLNQNHKPINNMLSDQDLKQIKARGISEEQVEYQLNQQLVLVMVLFPQTRMREKRVSSVGMSTNRKDTRL